MTTERMPPIWNREAYANCLSKLWMRMLIGGLAAGGIAAIEPRGLPARTPSRRTTRLRLSSRHCQACHAGPKPKGDFRLDSLTPDFSDKANRERWLTVLEQVKTGAMPPKEKPRPPAEDVQALTDWIAGRSTDEAAGSGQGRVVMRRLNRAEYENTVRDLLGVDVDLKDLLPPDPATNGFDNRAEALHVSSFLMEQYLEAADAVLDAAIANRAPADDHQATLRHQGGRSRSSRRAASIAIWTTAWRSSVRGSRPISR